MFLKSYLKYGFVIFLSILIIGSSQKHLLAQNKKEARKEAKKENEAAKSETKSILLKEKHSPHKATIYSLMLPGLGQAYNKKYWKIPIIYAGIGVMIYFISNNSREYKRFSDTYDYVEGDLEKTPYEDYLGYSSWQLKSARDIYRRNLDYSYIITGLWYLLNVVDASVDAHLFEFEVSDDLSLKIEPDIRYLPQDHKTYTGIKVSFKLPISKH